MSLKIYGYEKCSTCRKALKLLEQHGVEYSWIAIRETPPTRTELRQVLQKTGLPIRKLFNTSGQEYRFLGLKDKLHRMTDGQKIDLLARNGNLIKRPFVVGDQVALVGFNEDLWREALNLG